MWFVVNIKNPKRIPDKKHSAINKNKRVSMVKGSGNMSTLTISRLFIIKMTIAAKKMVKMIDFNKLKLDFAKFFIVFLFLSVLIAEFSIILLAF